MRVKQVFNSFCCYVFWFRNRILTCLAVVGSKYAYPYVEEISNRLEDREEISAIIALDCIHNFNKLQENIWQRVGRCLNVGNEAKCLGALQVFNLA